MQLRNTFQVRLSDVEIAGLRRMAALERRTPRDQAAVLIAQAVQAWALDERKLDIPEVFEEVEV